MTSMTVCNPTEFVRSFIRDNLTRIDAPDLPIEAEAKTNALVDRVIRFADLREAAQDQDANQFEWGLTSGNSVLTVAARFLCTTMETTDISGIRQIMLNYTIQDQRSLGATQACLTMMEQAFVPPANNVSPQNISSNTRPIASDYTGEVAGSAPIVTCETESPAKRTENSANREKLISALGSEEAAFAYENLSRLIQQSGSPFENSDILDKIVDTIGKAKSSANLKSASALLKKIVDATMSRQLGTEERKAVEVHSKLVMEAISIRERTIQQGEAELASKKTQPPRLKTTLNDGDRVQRQSEDALKKNAGVTTSDRGAYKMMEQTFASPANNVSLPGIIRNTRPIVPGYAEKATIDSQRNAHAQSKAFLKKYLPLTGASVQFVGSPGGDCPSHRDVRLKNDLDPKVFSWEPTTGVQDDIQRDGKRTEDNLVIYGVASQFNGSESPKRETVSPGKAVEVYKTDHTQGPQAQLQFSAEQVELLNCGANLGYNGLSPVLSNNTKSAVKHGYLCPKTSSEANDLIVQLRGHGNRIEYPCIGNKPTNSVGEAGSKQVLQILTAAPAFGMYDISNHSVSNEQKHEIQFLCALHSYRAQFHHAISLAKQGFSVVLKPTAVGLGAFGNETNIVAKAYYTAAKEYQHDLKNQNVEVCMQVFRGIGAARELVNYLGLKENLSKAK